MAKSLFWLSDEVWEALSLRICHAAGRVRLKALLADSPRGFRIAAGADWKLAREICAMPSAVRLRGRVTIQRRRFGALARPGRGTPSRAGGGFCRWLRSGMAWTGARRRRSAGWTSRTLRDWVHRFNGSGLEGVPRLTTSDGESQASPFGGATGSVRADRRGGSGGS